jgi:hypothetical protein
LVFLSVTAIVSGIACSAPPDASSEQDQTSTKDYKSPSANDKSRKNSSSTSKSGSNDSEHDEDAGHAGASSAGDPDAVPVVEDCSAKQKKGDCMQCCNDAYPKLVQREAKAFDDALACLCNACKSQCAGQTTCGGETEDSEACVDCYNSESDAVAACDAAQQATTDALEKDPEYIARTQCQSNSACKTKPTK